MVAEIFCVQISFEEQELDGMHLYGLLLLSVWKHVLKNSIYTRTAGPTMNSFASYGVHHLISAVSLGYHYLSCNNICDWSSKLNGAKT